MDIWGENSAKMKTKLIFLSVRAWECTVLFPIIGGGGRLAIPVAVTDDSGVPYPTSLPNFLASFHGSPSPAGVITPWDSERYLSTDLVSCAFSQN